MDTKFSIQNDVEEEMGIIHEESSDEDNSSKDEHQTGVEDRETNPVRPTVMGQRVKRTEATKKQGLDFWNLRAILKQNKGEISDIKSRENSNKLIGPLKKERSGKNLISEKLSKQNSDFAEEEKFNKKENRGTFEGFRDIFDRNRDQRSSSCKSATASLQFSNNRFFRKQFTSSPFKPLPKRSYKISSSTSKRRTHVSSFVGVANGKATEPSLIDFRKQMESHSKCLSEVSRRLSRRRSDTRMSVPINRYPSNSSLSSEYSGRIGNTSTTTFTSDITWEFRSCKLQPLDPRYKSHLVDAEFPFINNEKRNKMKMMRQFSRVGETLPELIE